MAGRGYFAWGPWSGPRSVHYLIASNGNNVDIFVFDENAFYYYQEDQLRDKPFNTGYSAVRSMLDTDNAEDTVALEANKRYYLVVDHTAVGAANGNDDGTYNQISFSWWIDGVEDSELGTPVNTNPVINAASPASPASAVLVAALAALLSLVL